MKLLVTSILNTALAALFFSGCTTLQPKPAPEIKTDQSLPVVSINGYIADMKAVAFEWKSVKDPRVNGYYVYRGEPNSKDPALTRVATIENRFTTHFTDNDVQPNTHYQYRFTTFSDELTQSAGSKTHAVNTLPVLSSVSFFHSIGNLPRMAKLIWRPHTNLNVESYQIERRDGDEGEWCSVGTVEGRLNAEFIDTDLKDNSLYYYRLLVNTFDGIQSTPTEIVKVVTKPLPKTVEGLQATTNQPKQISLEWQPNTQKDFDHYRLYRADSIDGSYDYHVKTERTEFVDKTEEDGEVHFYRITAVDKDDLEGLAAAVPVMGSSLVKPKKPMMLKATFVNNTYRLQWKNGDARTVSYIVLKKTKTSWVSSEIEEITNIHEAQFTDINVAADTGYEYQVVAVDKYGIRSEPTEALLFSFSSKK